MLKNERCSLVYTGKLDERVVIDSLQPARLKELKTVGKTGNNANMLIRGDNLPVLKKLLADKEAGRLVNADGTSGVRLIYLDPPFGTRLSFKMDAKDGLHAYHDRLTGAHYIDALRARLILLRGLLSDDGSIYLHLDWKMSHYMKVMMDEIFGQENFLNEIIWHYGGRGAKAASGQFPRNHDAILLYRNKAHIFNRQYLGKRIKKGASGVQRDDEGRWFKTAPRGDYTDASIASLSRQGRIYKTRTNKLRIKYFLREDGEWLIEDKPIGDVWDDIPDAMHLSEAEKTGYPTQKPLVLLERIINTSSNKGDTVLDAFCGSGTTLVAAARLGRRWIGIDSGPLAIKTAQTRLKEVYIKGHTSVSFSTYKADR
ncbi:MAG: hypothetical protein A3J24_04245 [Deltaproteobacteria bacterium RIFCSPLOWO2_02_FULL_53_8]|nr:MAG: hypothetical protein A3J24_04245 [Deltaproteobacteria bacterium RIFCSPLOWO2_02_FULL_53_8]